MNRPGVLARPTHASVHSGPVLAAGAVVGLGVLGDSLLYAVLPTHHAAFGVPLELVGVLLSANRLVRLVFNSVAGRLYERLGPRPPFVLGAVGSVVTTGALVLLSGFWPLLVIRLLWGGSWSLLRLGGYVAVLRWAGGQRGRALGLFWAAVRGGMLVGGFGGALLVDAIGLPAALVLLTLATAGAIPIATALTGRLASDPAPDVAIDVSAPAGANWWGDRAELAVCLATALLAFATQGLVFATLGLLLLERLGEDVRLGWMLVGVTTLTGGLQGAQRAVDLVLGPIVGPLADRFGPTAIVRSGLAVASAAALALFAAGAASPLVGAVLLLWLGSAIALVGLDVSAAGLAHDRGGARLLARYATWIDLGAAGGPVTGYALATTLGVGSLPLVAAGLLAGAGLAHAVGRR